MKQTISVMSYLLVAILAISCVGSAKGRNDKVPQAKEGMGNNESFQVVEDEERVTDAEYTLLLAWDFVRLDFSSYHGKKIRIKGTLGDIRVLEAGSYWDAFPAVLIEQIGYCPFDSLIKEKLEGLEENKDYTFYGTVITNPYGIVLEIIDVR